MCFAAPRKSSRKAQFVNKAEFVSDERDSHHRPAGFRIKVCSFALMRAGGNFHAFLLRGTPIISGLAGVGQIRRGTKARAVLRRRVGVASKQAGEQKCGSRKSREEFHHPYPHD